MSSAQLHIEDAGPVRILTLDHADKRNALNRELLTKLSDAIAPDQSSHVRAFIIRGAGERAFCSGYDLQSLEPVGQGDLPDDLIGRVYAQLEAHKAPSIACLNGAAFGAGFELATACDFRIAAATATLGMPPAKLGVVYAPEGLQRLIRLVGHSTAKLLFLTGRSLSAQQAVDMRLVDEIHETPEAAFFAARQLAEELSRNAPLAVAGMKQIFTALGRAPLTTEDQQQFRALRRDAFNSEDVQEGRSAFLHKRTPAFKGR